MDCWWDSFWTPKSNPKRCREEDNDESNQKRFREEDIEEYLLKPPVVHCDSHKKDIKSLLVELRAAKENRSLTYEETVEIDDIYYQ